MTFVFQNEEISVFRQVHTIHMFISICTDTWSCVCVYIIAIQTHIFVDSFCTTGIWVSVSKSRLHPPLASEEEEEKTLWYESGSVLPWLPSFNSLFKTSTLKKKICSPLGEWTIWQWQKFISQLQRCNSNGDRQSFKGCVREVLACQHFKNPDV